jgi:hypothetical protein
LGETGDISILRRQGQEEVVVEIQPRRERRADACENNRAVIEFRFEAAECGVRVVRKTPDFAR